MAYTEQGYQASLKYKAKNIKRIPLDVQKDFYDELAAAAAAAGEKVNEYIKNAIKMRMEAQP